MKEAYISISIIVAVILATIFIAAPILEEYETKCTEAQGIVVKAPEGRICIKAERIKL